MKNLQKVVDKASRLKRSLNDFMGFGVEKKLVATSPSGDQSTPVDPKLPPPNARDERNLFNFWLLGSNRTVPTPGSFGTSRQTIADVSGVLDSPQNADSLLVGVHRGVRQGIRSKNCLLFAESRQIVLTVAGV
jgi:hypothetical protein